MDAKAVSVEVVKPYEIEVAFEDGTRRRLDLESELWGEVFEPLRDPELFAQARVDPEWGTVVWPTGADLSPEFLHQARVASRLGD
jgi:hypothetical protein